MSERSERMALTSELIDSVKVSSLISEAIRNGNEFEARFGYLTTQRQFQQRRYEKEVRTS